MSVKKAKQKQVKKEQVQQPQQQTIPIDQVLQAQFAKVGQLTFQIEIMQQQLMAFEKENNKLKEQLKEK